MFGFVVPRGGVLACRLALGSLVAPCVLAAGCVDPAARFDDFGERLAERERKQGASMGDDEEPAEGCEPVTAAQLAGSYYFAFRSKVAEDTPILALLELSPRDLAASGTYELDVVFEPLALADGRTPLGRASTGVMKVQDGRSFAIDDFDIFIAGDANPVLPGTDFHSLMNLGGKLCGAGELPVASLCGTTLGALLEPVSVNLDGSTFGALRLEAAAPPMPAGSCAETAGGE
jgi:hypothetical protein